MEKNYYDRTLNMLKTIKNLEDSNVKNKMKAIADESLKSLQDYVNNTSNKDRIHRESFEGALIGLRKGEMRYENDPILPYFIEQFTSKTQALKGLTQEQ